MIINIRGCNGSGKSTIVRKLLMGGLDSEKLYGVCGPKFPEAYRLDYVQVKRPIFVLGSYLVGVGGCDRIGSAELVQQLVHKYAAQGHVLFEGLIISDYYGKLCTSLEPFGKEVVIIFLTTPFEVCLDRLHARQAASSGRGEKNVRHHYDANLAVCKRMKADGRFQVLELASEEVEGAILRLLK